MTPRIDRHSGNLNEIPRRGRAGGVRHLDRPVRDLFVTQSRGVGTQTGDVALLAKGYGNTTKPEQVYMTKAHAKAPFKAQLNSG